MGRHALSLYFVLSFAGFWGCLALAPVAPMLPYLGVLSPGVAAVVVCGFTEGEPAVRALAAPIVLPFCQSMRASHARNGQAS